MARLSKLFLNSGNQPCVKALLTFLEKGKHMKTQRHLLSAAVLFFLSVNISTYAGFNDTVFGSFFFIQLSDPQFGQWTAKPYPNETANFNLAIDHVNRLKPPFVVLTGDYQQSSTDTAQVNAYKRGLARLNPAIIAFSTPGNHDIGLPPTLATINAWKADYGADRLSFVYNNCLFILLNAPIIKDSTGFPAGLGQQRAWLDSVLNAADLNRYSRIFVLQHYSYFLLSPTEANAYFNIDMPRRTAYLSLFKQHGVTAVFAGHLHDTSVARDGALSMVTTGAVGQPLGSAPSGLRIIKVYADSVRWPYYGLNAVPQSIDMPPTAVTTPFLRVVIRQQAPPAGGFFIVNAAGRKICGIFPGERDPFMYRQFTGAAGFYLLAGVRTRVRVIHCNR